MGFAIKLNFSGSAHKKIGVSTAATMIPPKRKKWTEAEEKTLIDKYGEMVSDGTLAKMKTREKKFRPISCYVNSVHHVQDPHAYPWQWTWKDVSTKVQNMRHQYLLVKQKIKKPDLVGDNSGVESSIEEFDWIEGVTHWSNFLRYKDVFGDVPVPASTNINSVDLMALSNGDRENNGRFGGVCRGMDMMEFANMDHSGDGDFAVGIDGVENGVISLGFEYDGDKGEENFECNDKFKEDVDGFVYEEVEHKGLNLKKKRKSIKRFEKSAWGFLANQLGQLKDMEARFQNREMERDRERQRMENLRKDLDQKWEKNWELREMERVEREKTMEKLREQRIQEWEAMENDSKEMEKRRRDEESDREREWEERMNKRKCEWKNKIDEMLSQHRVEMSQIQTRILHEQQNLTSQLLGIVPQWSTHLTGLSDHASASNHYLSQLMQNLHHVNDMVHDDARVEGDNQDDQFIVDG